LIGLYSSHGACKIVTKAFCGKNIKCIPVENYKTGSPITYGLARGLHEALERARKLGEDWWFIDRGYMNPGHYLGYYSVTKNAYQHLGRGIGRELPKGIEVLSPMKRGKFILLLPPTIAYSTILGIDHERWTEDTTRRVLRYTDRPIKIRIKGETYPIEEELIDCHGVIAYNSKAVIEASCMGVPIYTTHNEWGSNIQDLEDPDMHFDRMTWLRTLAANQFTIAEMESGYCLQQLRESYGM